MLAIKAVAFCTLLGATLGADLNFPPGFKFGVASASYPVEGAWNVGDKSENIWERFIHDDQDRISGRDNDDVAGDSYHLWTRDIEMIEEIGAHFYSFSLSWTRLLPDGFANSISEDGKNYYNNLINGLLETGIEPVVTIYHWDLPQSLQDLGGWENPLIIDWFGDYARVAFSLFGDRVKTWITINEPLVVCDMAYNSTRHALGILNPNFAIYLCNKNILLAHATAYRIYDKEFRSLYHGELSISNSLMWIDGLAPEYESLAELSLEHLIGRYSHPIYTQEGGWPPALAQALAEKSKQQGFPKFELLEFTPEEIDFLKGTFDYYGVNFYTSRRIRPAEPGEEILWWWPLKDVPDWTPTTSSAVYVNSEAFRKQLVWLKKQYGDIKFFITENGYPTAGGLSDDYRINFYRDHLEQVNLAIKEDGVQVVGYTALTLMDNFEWTKDYRSQHGLYQRDLSSPESTRTPQASAALYRENIKKNTLRQSSTRGILSFPPGFKFGIATAAYQVEGGWNEGDKTNSTWDWLVHEHPDIILDRSTGDIACDSYNQWERDIEMAAELGVHHYRISISWPRLLPEGFSYHISEDGLRYYNNLIDGLLQVGIEPMVTLYHWDLPYSMQEKYGGWLNPVMSDWFAEYARVCFRLFGDRVNTWITINEPVIMCDAAYIDGHMAPAIADPLLGPFLCNKHVLLAHAKAWRIYDEEFRHLYHGQVSIANQNIWFEPLSDEEAELTDLVLQNYVGRYSHPIFSEEGGWPPSLAEYMERLGHQRGLNRSMLPSFTQEEIEFIRGTYDYYALNHYTSRLVRHGLPEEVLSDWPTYDCPDLNAKVVKPDHWPAREGAEWLWVYPEGLRKLLVWLKQQYGNIPFVITENGYATLSGLNDYHRVSYYRTYLEQVALAIQEDAVNVTKYTAWSLMDNFEWLDGYSIQFGLYEVDFSSPERTRTPRLSARYYADVIRYNAVLPEPEN